MSLRPSPVKAPIRGFALCESANLEVLRLLLVVGSEPKASIFFGDETNGLSTRLPFLLRAILQSPGTRFRAVLHGVCLMAIRLFNVICSA